MAEAMSKKQFLIGLACALSLAFNARAEQSGIGHYVPGQNSDFSCFAPATPGWYFLNYYMAYNNGTFSAAKGLPLGQAIGLNATINYSAEAPTVIYAYPFNFFGGTLSSGISVPYAWVDVKVQGTVVNRNRTVQQSSSGLGDIQLMPAMAAWTNGDFQFNTMFNVWAPSGSYEKTQIDNVGLGYWTFEPMLAFGWLSSTIGTEVSVFTAIDFNTKNTESDYQSGDIFHVDATVAQHLPLAGGFLGVGATAFYLKQINGDSGSGAVLGDFKVETYGVGPTISYVHAIGKSMLIVDGSWLPQTHSDNTTKGDYFWGKLTFVF